MSDCVNPEGNKSKLRCSTQVACFLDACELQDYINETGWWDRRSETPQVRNSTQAPGFANANLADPVALTGLHEVGLTSLAALRAANCKEASV